MVVFLFSAGGCEQSTDQTTSGDAIRSSTPQLLADSGSQPTPLAATTRSANAARPPGARTPAARGTRPPVATKADSFKPVVGQAGKDVVWVPTPQPLVDKMLEMANLTRNDIHFDLGSGDGRTVITAAKRGANSTGVEYNPDMVALSKRLAEKEGVGDKAMFVEGDIFKTNFSHATVVTLFLLPDLNLKLRPTLLNMKPGTRVVSNTFTMGDWEPDETRNIPEEGGCSSYCTAHLWIVPAKVEGRWRLPDGELRLTQTFQRLSGTLGATPVQGTLRGDQITFVAGNAQYTGQVNGNTVTGRVRNGSSTRPFTATRLGS